MDDQQTYLLNGLLNRHFGLGRIVRFRNIDRGGQSEAFELFTAQEREYVVYLYPPTFTADQLNFAAKTVNALDAHRFSVVPFIESKIGAFTAEGPQNSHMLVSLAPTGSALPPARFTDHDISQLALRLAWMHRLLKEQVARPDNPIPIEERVRHLAQPPLLSLLKLPAAQGWAHGDIQGPGLLHDADHQLRSLGDWGLLHFGCPLEDIVDAFLLLATDPDGSLNIPRGRVLLEAYDSLVPIKRIAWTPVVAHWCAQRLLDHSHQRRKLPAGFHESFAPAPERLAIALASCL